MFVVIVVVVVAVVVVATMVAAVVVVSRVVAACFGSGFIHNGCAAKHMRARLHPTYALLPPLAPVSAHP